MGTNNNQTKLYGYPLVSGGIAGPKEDIKYSDFDVISYVANMESRVKYQRQQFERSWYRNILFYLGKQWIAFDTSASKWVKPKTPTWVPLPMTNRFAANVDAMVSVLDSVNPETIISPKQDDPASMATADVCNDIIDIIKSEVGFKKIKERMKRWLGLTGDVFLIPYYSNGMEHGIVFIPDLKCNVCGFAGSPDSFQEGVCPACQSKNSGEEFVDPETGKTAGINYPRGKMCMDVASSFEMYGDLRASSIEESSYILRAKTYSIEDVRRMWPEKADKIIAESRNDLLGQEYLATIAHTTNSLEDSASAGRVDDSERATVWQIWIRPNQNFKRGMYAVVCDKVVLEEPKELPYVNDEGTPFVNIIQIKWNDIDGRLFAKTPADDLIHKQIQRNKIESFIMLCNSRMASPMWLVPETSGVGTISGEPGEIVEYNDSGNAKAKPERVGGVEIPQSIFRYLEKIDEDFEELAATYDIIKGSTPKNTPTLGGLEVLKERGLSRFGNVINNYEEAVVRLTEQWLWIWKEYASEYRVKTSIGKNSKWEIKQYNSTSLTGNVNVRIEPGTSSPKSEAYQQYLAGQLLANGLIDPRDPQTKLHILTRFHATEFAKDLDIDIKDAIREQEEFKEGKQLRLRPLIDNNNIHLEMHKQFAKTEEFFELPEEQQAEMYKHIQATFSVNMQQQQMMSGGPQKEQQSQQKPVGEVK